MKTYLKLLIKCICVMFPMIAVCLYSRTNVFSYIDSEAPYYTWNRQFTNTSHTAKYNVVIIGDSTANAAYMPEVLSDSTINLSLGGNTPMESYYTLQDWLKSNAAPSDIFISFQDSHFNKAATFWTRTIYSHRYDIKQNIEMLRAGLLYNDNSIISDNYKNDFIKYQCYLPSKYITALMNASFNQRLDLNTSAFENVGFHFGRYIAIGNNEYTTEETLISDSFAVGDLYDYYYRKIIELCKQNDIIVHLVKLPHPENESYTETYVSQITSYYDQLLKQYDNLSFEWYNESYARYYFSDNYHMNTHGALKFSTYLKGQYPNIFDSSYYSDEQINVINSNILNENKAAEFFKWIDGRDYTVLLYDGTGDIEELYPLCLKSNKLELQKKDTTALGGELPIYCINGNNTNSDNYTLYNIENGIGIRIEGQDDFLWYPFSVSGISIAVIDNYNNKVICARNSTYIAQEAYFSNVVNE